jgi:hypothetical protein
MTELGSRSRGAGSVFYLSPLSHTRSDHRRAPTVRACGSARNALPQRQLCGICCQRRALAGRRDVPPGPCGQMGQPWRERPPSCARSLTPVAPPGVVHATAAPRLCPAKRHAMKPPLRLRSRSRFVALLSPESTANAGGQRSTIAAQGVGMPEIKARTRGKHVVRHITRLDRESYETLFAYAAFLASRRSTCSTSRSTPHSPTTKNSSHGATRIPAHTRRGRLPGAPEPAPSAFRAQTPRSGDPRTSRRLHRRRRTDQEYKGRAQTLRRADRPARPDGNGDRRGNRHLRCHNVTMFPPATEKVFLQIVAARNP